MEVSHVPACKIMLDSTDSPRVPWIKVVPVASVAFNGDVPFTTVRSDEYNSSVSLSGSGSSGSGTISRRADEFRAIL